VHEELAVGFEPPGDAAEQRPVVAYVLEHLDGHDTVETAVRVEDVGVGRDDLDVGQTSVFGSVQNELPLRRGIRHAQDAAIGIMLGRPQAEGAPAATQVEDLHALLDPGTFADLPQRRFFRVGQGGHAGGPVATTVLQTRTQDLLEKRGRHLVVLFVGLVGGDRDRAFPQLADQVHLRLQLLRGAVSSFRPQTTSVQGPDACSDHQIRDSALLHHVDQPFHGASRLGNQGMKGLVICWYRR